MRRATKFLTAFSGLFLVGAAVAITPLQAKPSTTPTRNTPTSGSGCYVTDANGVTTFDASCSYHLTWQTDSAGNLLAAMYNDHGQLPAGAALPSSTLIRDISFDDVRCEERVAPSGQYNSNCYAQVRSQ